jgi:threonine/homoserine/homoserine lactone efflux protein
MPYLCSMDLSRAAAFSGVAFLVILFPGPSVLFIVSRAISLGRVPALITVVGNQLGELLQVGAVAFGVGAIVSTSELAFTVVKLLGAAYLVFLGMQTIRRGRSPALSAAELISAGPWQLLRQAVAVGVSNPKTSVFFAAVLPQFVDMRLGHVPIQMLVLGGIWAVIALASDSAWGLAASGVRSWLTRSPRRFPRMQAASGVVIVGLGVGLALSGRSTSS